MTTKTHTEAGPVAQGAALVITLGDKAQFTLQTHYDRDAEEYERDAVIDRLYRDGRRMAAHYKIEELIKLISGRQDGTAFTDANFQRGENDYEMAKARRLKEIDQIRQDDEAGFSAGPRRGDYTPSKAAVQRVAGIQAEQRKADEERAKILADHQVTKGKLENDIAVWRKEIAVLEAFLNASDS
jgi:hypothetical protein